jgi:hypothetical protein
MRFFAIICSILTQNKTPFYKLDARQVFLCFFASLLLEAAKTRRFAFPRHFTFWVIQLSYSKFMRFIRGHDEEINNASA